MSKYQLLTAAAASTVLIFSTSAGAANLLVDTFGSGSTLNTSPTSPTATSTSYETYSTKNSSGSTIAAGDLHLALSGTTTGGTLGLQAKFPSVTLAASGDYVDFTYTFTGANLLGDTSGLYIGLDNSGGTMPATGLANAGQTGTTNVTGNAQNWIGYTGQIRNGSVLRNVTRTAQGAASNVNQDTLFTGIGSSGYQTPTGTQIGAAGATVVQTLGADTYTETFRVTLNPDLATETVLTTLFDVTSSTTLQTISTATVVGTTQQTLTFDALSLGAYKSGGTAAIPTFDISNISVTTNVSTPEPAALGLLSIGGVFMGRRRRTA